MGSSLSDPGIDDVQREARARAVVTRVSSWFAREARPFPWRAEDCSAWGILVSEVMSQQTPMARVLPRWQEFMSRWPTPADFAAASDADAIRMWDRLGYPRRALALRRCAQAIVRDHGGRVPRETEVLLRLPGVGPYTAGAVASFAYSVPAPVVDTNIRRVIARAVHGEAIAWPADHRRDEREALALLPHDGDAAKAWNAGAMELGAVLCTARTPRCALCPIADLCRWREAGYPEAVASPRRQPRFEGSDRQRRGRIMAVLRARHGGVPRADLPALLGLVDTDETERHFRIADALIDEGLAERTGERILLAGDVDSDAQPETAKEPADR